jgi:hypothetical protein
MQCPVCNADLEQDDQIDTTVIDADACTHNFKCTNDDCAKHFEIEFHPVNTIEIDYDNDEE